MTKLEQKQVKKFSKWCIKRFKMNVTNIGNLPDWFIVYGYRGMIDNILRWEKYRKIMKEKGLREFIYARRWNRFIENLEKWESDQAMLVYINRIEWINKQKNPDDVYLQRSQEKIKGR